MKPGGILIDAHDIPKPASIYAYYQEQSQYIGQLLDSSDFEFLRRTDEAIEIAVREGLFAFEDEEIFVYNIHIDEQKDFNEWFDQLWDTNYLLEETEVCINNYFKKNRQTELVIYYTTRMTCLRRLL